MGGQENIKKEKKIKIRYIILILICIIVAAAAVVTIWQWDNIKALRYALGTSEEELEQEMAATQQELDDAAKEYNVPEINLTDEELAALESGIWISTAWWTESLRRQARRRERRAVPTAPAARGHPDRVIPAAQAMTAAVRR